MTSPFSTAMRRAMELTRASDVVGATRAIQSALAGHAATEPAPASDPHVVQQLEAPLSPAGSPVASEPLVKERAHKPLSEVLRILKKGRAKVLDVPLARTPPVPTPDGATFVARTMSTDFGTRDFKVFIPSGRAEPPRGLIVMLHGCTQNPDDFAVGTGMNAIAEADNFVVAYPKQTASANSGACWNWFLPAHQVRDRGEPALIAAITRALMAEFDIPAEHVFAAGLSAGGAMAAILAETYPEIYSAVGVHSGLAYGSANDVMSAFSAMRGERLVSARKPAGTATARMILFHGSRDTTVHPSNLQALVAGRADAGLQQVDEPAANSNGRNVHRQVFQSGKGEAVLEVWKIDGAGHAWSGGNESGSFTDRTGPNASAEMVRFFFRDDR